MHMKIECFLKCTLQHANRWTFYLFSVLLYHWYTILRVLVQNVGTALKRFSNFSSPDSMTFMNSHQLNPYKFLCFLFRNQCLHPCLLARLMTATYRRLINREEDTPSKHRRLVNREDNMPSASRLIRVCVASV